MGKHEAALLPALTLAYIGDSYYELKVREYLVCHGSLKVDKLHKKAVSLVRADYQSILYYRLKDKLSDDELAQLKRGRNVKSGHCPKNADIADYKRATGLECLVGYLYVADEMERLREIFVMIFAIVEEKSKSEV